MSGFHSGFSGGSFAHPSFSSGNFSHNWSMGTPYIASRVGPGTIHTGSFALHNGNWNWGDNSLHANWNRSNVFWNRRGFDWGDWWRYGYARPWIGLGWWWPGYYDYGYYDYGYPYYGYYGYDNPYYVDYDVTPTTVYSPEPVETETPVETVTPMLANSETDDFHSQALAAFQQGDYRDAVRLATHAIVDNPKSAQDHLLLSLALFAVGQYRGAAMEGHAVAALGTIPDWAMVIGIYNNNVEAYTQHLRTLEKFARNNKTAPEGRFLLGFQYMIDGHQVVARDQLLQALRLTPRDNVAAQLLTREGGTIPADIAKQLQAGRQQPPISGIGPGATR
jgi:tetratricopeptide (TPR) repeat protein